MEVLNGCKIVGKAVVSKADQKRVYVRVSRATHHENESASQILVAVDLYRGLRRRGAEKGRAGKSQILCTHYRFEHFSGRASFPLAGLSVRSFERETADAFRKTGAILWETARRFGKVMTNGYLNLGGASTNTHLAASTRLHRNKFVRRLVVRILMK